MLKINFLNGERKMQKRTIIDLDENMSSRTSGLPVGRLGLNAVGIILPPPPRKILTALALPAASA
jgi:hypothetical protein